MGRAPFIIGLRIIGLKPYRLGIVLYAIFGVLFAKVSVAPIKVGLRIIGL
jgi:hypothetical protein